MTHPTQVTGVNFFGAEVTFDQCEILAVQNIHPKLLKGEAALFKTKWFDYRPFHPTMATYMAVHYYNRAYGFFMASAMDHKKRFMAGFKGKDFMLSREKQSFWKMRQQIDQVGIRYDFFLMEAMKWCIENGWRQPPRPAMIATNADMIVHITNLWQHELRTRIQWAVADRYRASMFAGTPDQLAYEEHIVSNIAKKAHPKYALSSALYTYDALRIEEAIRNFPCEAISEAMTISCEKISQH